MKYQTSVNLCIILLSISACTSLEDDLPRFQQMSCPELAAEIQDREGDLKNARIDAVIGGIGSIAGDTEEDRDLGELDLDIASTEAETAKEYISALKAIYNRKGCRPYFSSNQ